MNKDHCDYCIRSGNLKDEIITKKICKHCKLVHIYFYKEMSKIPSDLQPEFKRLLNIWKHLK